MILVLMAGQIVQASEPLSPIQQAALRIRDARIEHMAIFNEQGKQIGESVGSAMEASPPGDVSLSNATVLHNHVYGVSLAWFSHNDYLFARSYYVRRLVVIAPAMVGREKMYIQCALERSKDERWPALDVDEFLKQMRRRGYHAAWTEYATQRGLHYQCMVLP